MACDSALHGRKRSPTTVNHQGNRVQQRLLVHLEEFREYRKETEAVFGRIFEINEQAEKDAKEHARSLDVRLESHSARSEDLGRRQEVFDKSLGALQIALHSILSTSKSLEQSISELQSDLTSLQKESKESREERANQQKAMVDIARRGDKSVAKEVLGKLAELNDKLGLNMHTLQSQLKSDIEEMECKFRTVDARVDVNALDVQLIHEKCVKLESDSKRDTQVTQQIHARCAKLESDSNDARIQNASSWKRLEAAVHEQACALQPLRSDLENQLAAVQALTNEVSERISVLEQRQKLDVETVSDRLSSLEQYQKHHAGAVHTFETSIKQRTTMMVRSAQLDLEELVRTATDEGKIATAEIADLKSTLERLSAHYESCSVQQQEFQRELDDMTSSSDHSLTKLQEFERKLDNMTSSSDHSLTKLQDSIKKVVECRREGLEHRIEELERRNEAAAQQLSEDMVDLREKVHDILVDTKVFHDREADLEARCDRLHSCIVEQTAVIDDAKRGASRTVADKMAEFRSELRGELFEREQCTKHSLMDLRRELQGRIDGPTAMPPGQTPSPQELQRRTDNAITESALRKDETMSEPPEQERHIDERLTDSEPLLQSPGRLATSWQN